MTQRTTKKENKNNTSLHLFSPLEGMTLLETIQSWRGDGRLDTWKEHFLASLAHRLYSAGREFDLSEDQVEKLEEIREIMEGPADGVEPWRQQQKAAKRRIAAGAPLASNLWWEKSASGQTFRDEFNDVGSNQDTD